MKKIVIFAAAVILMKLTGLLPFEANDVASLLPVRALVVDMQNGQILLDGGDVSGSGPTLNAALEDMKNGAEGTLFLATAEQVILSPRARGLLPQVCRWENLRPAAQIILAAEELPDPEKAADYLEAHQGGITLQQARAALLRGQRVRLPLLHVTERGLRLETRENG